MSALSVDIATLFALDFTALLSLRPFKYFIAVMIMNALMGIFKLSQLILASI